MREAWWFFICPVCHSRPVFDAYGDEVIDEERCPVHILGIGRIYEMLTGDKALTCSDKCKNLLLSIDPRYWD